MKRPRHLSWWTDLIVLVIIAFINPVNPLTPYHPFTPPCIPDKVEIYYTQRLSSDSIQQLLLNIEKELNEMKFYFKVHNVTDQGYNQVASYRTSLLKKQIMLQQQDSLGKIREVDSLGKIKIVTALRKTVPAKDRTLIAVKMHKGYWWAGHFHTTPFKGKAIAQDNLGRLVSAVYDADTIVSAMRTDSLGTYYGQMDEQLQACGHGRFEAFNGEYYDGKWLEDQRHGFGFQSSPYRHLRVGEWKKGRFLGERLRYTNERIYGIDISRHQHEKGRRRYSINWNKVRITSLGARHNTEGRTYPISFVYIKSTEGTTIRNRYYINDYMKAKKQGIRVGAYHFFSMKSPAKAQALYFVRHTLFRKGDFPPVLDVEPSEAQIKKIGGDEVLMNRIRTFMEIVERHTGMRPILYVNQGFINKHMDHAADIKDKYNVWIARYGQYKPDVKLVYWQLCADGKVDGIKGPVDINVFNGYQEQFEEFIHKGYYK